MNNNQITLNLNDAQAKLLKEYYLLRIDELRANPIVREYEEYKNIINTIELQLNVSPEKLDIRAIIEKTFNPEPTQKKDINEPYNSEWALSKKAEFAILKKGKPLTTRDIISVIMQEEPGIFKKHGIDFDRLQKNLGSTLKQKIDKSNTFFRFKIGDAQEFYYGLIAESDKYNIPASQAYVLAI